MAQIKDDLGREFIPLTTLSAALDLSIKQVRRHIRDKRLLSVKRGQRRYILKDDVLREYPSLSPESLNRDIRDISRDNRDTIGTSIVENDVLDVPIVPDVSLEKELTLYQTDQKTDMVLTKIEQVKTVMTRLEKSIADIGYIQQDTKTIDRKLDRVNAKMSLLEGHKGHWIFSGILTIIVLAVIGAGIYGVIRFNRLYEDTQNNYNSQISVKDKELAAGFEKYTDTIKHYEQKTGEKDLTIEKLKVKLDQQTQKIGFLQETIAQKDQEEEKNGHKNTESNI